MTQSASLRPFDAGVVRRNPDLAVPYLDAVRLCLDGGSPLDWYRLQFTERSQVELFLQVNRADPADDFDRARLEHLHRQAIRYVERHFGYRLPENVTAPERIEDLFLLAGEDSTFRRSPMLACVLLKLMHVINHLEARSLMHETAVSESEIELRAERHLLRSARQMKLAGVPIDYFHGNRKSRDSMVTKLLVKPSATAATILDRVRFRIVTLTREDLVPTLAHLLRHVLPFNHVLATESVNNLVDLDAWIEDRPDLRALADELHPAPPGADMERPYNEFSSDDFRIINFIAEVPVRLDQLPSQAGRRFDPKIGRIVYVKAELQVVDVETARRNEFGLNSHDAYKRRQHRAAEQRLKYGPYRSPRDTKRSAS